MTALEGVPGILWATLSNPIFAVFLTLFLFWLGWVLTNKPGCKEITDQETYLDDSKISKVEIFDCKFKWGTKFFPFRKCKLLDVAVTASIAIRYVPPGGIESQLNEQYYDAIPIKNREIKPIELKNRDFFKKYAIEKVRVIVQTPVERDTYAKNIKREFDGKTLTVCNENTEEIRNFELVLSKPVKIDSISIIQGKINSVNVDIPFSNLKSVISKPLGQIETDVTMTLLMDFPAKKVGRNQETKINLN